MAQKSTKPSIIKDHGVRKVVEVGLHLTAGQLRRLESLMDKWGVKMAVLPEAEPPYKNLSEWFTECTEDEKLQIAKVKA